MNSPHNVSHDSFFTIPTLNPCRSPSVGSILCLSEFPSLSRESDRTNNPLFFSVSVFFVLLSFFPLLLKSPPSFSVGICYGCLYGWRSNVESCCSIRRLHYLLGILESLSSCRRLSSLLPPPLSFFLSPSPSRAPLAIQRREALRN